MRRVEAYKVTEWRDGCVYKTKLVCSLWIGVEELTPEEEQALARQHGGDILSNTNDFKF